MLREKLDQLLITENDQLKKLNSIVVKAIEEEKLLSQKLFEWDEKKPAFSSKIANSVAAFGGSWKFILSFIGFLLIWMIINVLLLQKPFDPFPFILLNLLLSAIAAVRAPIIMMSRTGKRKRIASAPPAITLLISKWR